MTDVNWTLFSTVVGRWMTKAMNKTQLGKLLCEWDAINLLLLILRHAHTVLTTPNRTMTVDDDDHDDWSSELLTTTAVITFLLINIFTSKFWFQKFPIFPDSRSRSRSKFWSRSRVPVFQVPSIPGPGFSQNSRSRTTLNYTIIRKILEGLWRQHYATPWW